MAGSALSWSQVSTTEPVRPGTAEGRKEHVTSVRRAKRRDAVANQERVLAAAATAVLRDGHQVPMSTIADLAGVGVGTLYRRYPTREALLGALTERSFELVRTLAGQAAARDEPGIASLDWFLEGTIRHGDRLVLPLHGGPAELSVLAQRIRAQVHASIEQVVLRGQRDGTIAAGVTTMDVVIFGAMLAQPLPNALNWESVTRRQKAIFLAGIGSALDRGSEGPA